MELLTKHITALLQQHDCVVVPELGGFIASETEAEQHKENYTFLPPRRTLRFNPDLKHNDGLLAGAYMETVGITYREATLKIETAVAQLFRELKSAHELTIDQIGTLQLNEEGAIEFHPGKSSRLNANHYGLPETRILPHNRLKKEPSAAHPFSADTDTIYISLNKRMLRTIASAAAIVALTICISFPVNTGQEPLLSAALVPTLPVELPTLLKTAPEPEVIEPEKGAVEEPVTLPANTTTYYIIVGSFPDESSAGRELNALKKNGYTSSGIITRNGRSRLYSAQFSDKQEAENNLLFYRTQLNRPDAWIFACK